MKRWEKRFLVAAAVKVDLNESSGITRCPFTRVTSSRGQLFPFSSDSSISLLTSPFPTCSFLGSVENVLNISSMWHSRISLRFILRSSFPWEPSCVLGATREIVYPASRVQSSFLPCQIPLPFLPAPCCQMPSTLRRQSLSARFPSTLSLSLFLSLLSLFFSPPRWSLFITQE